MASKIASKAPVLRRLSKWFAVGGLGLIALGLALEPLASSLPVNFCSAPGYGAIPEPCTEQDEQNRQVKILFQRTEGYIIWSGIAVAAIAFISWVNVRRW